MPPLLPSFSQQAPPAEPPTQPGDPLADQSYFPRWKMRLIIRFGEFGQIGKLAASVPKKPARSLAGVNPSRNALVAKPDPLNPGQFLLQPQGGSAPAVGGPQAQGQSSDNLTHVIEGVVPQEFRWSQNGIRTGDSLSATIRFIDCPIDPRTVRSVAVEFYLGTVTASEAAAQAQGQSGGDPTGGGAGEPPDLLPDTYTDARGGARTNLRFQGWVDKWKNSWSGGQPTIQLECTDNTRMLIKIDAPQKTLISTTDPLDVAIANYLASFPTLAGLSVQYRPTGATPPTIGKVSTKASIRGGKGRGPTKNAGTEKMSVWDHITDTCRALGHAVYVEGSTVVITRTRAITSSNVEPRGDDPYVARQLPSGEALPYRRMVHGRNCKLVEIERDFATHPPCNISVRAFDNEQKRIIVERFPLSEDKQVYALPGSVGTDEKWLELTVGGGIKDGATLRIYAQDVYENMGRQEIAVNVETANLASFGGGNEDPDLLDARFGDALQLQFTSEEFYSSLSELQQDLDSVALNSQRLQQAGFPAGFADAYARAYTNAGFTDLFRVHQMEVCGSTEGDSGVSVTIRAVNYVEVTSDKSLPAGEEPPAIDNGAAPRAPRAAPPAPGPAPGDPTAGILF